jgi:two-component system chemotaxis response regulator CheY
MLRMLAVEDSRSIRIFLRGALSRHGELDLAEDGRAGVELAALAMRDHAPYDLIVMDIMMPELDGLTAVRAIRSLEAETGSPAARILMLSCLTDAAHMLEAQFECGADGYLTKPFDMDVLFEAMANLGLIENPLGSVFEEGEGP